VHDDPEIAERVKLLDRERAFARGEGSSPADMARALDEFEMWYRSTHSDAFWIHFEHYIPETPRVDF
jgi:hypothetical protein